MRNLIARMKQHVRTTDVILKKWEHVIALIALIFSVFSIIASYHIGKTVADYEFKLSQTPKVLILNQEIQIPFKYDYDIDKTSLGGIEGAVDFASISDEAFALKIPISNVGTGLAQNCKVELKSSSQRKAILMCRDIFQLIGLQAATGTLKSGYDYETYLQNYSYEFEEGELREIEWHGDFERYTQLDTDQILSYPYIIPIIEEQEKNYFEIPVELSAFISEAIRQEMESSKNKEYEDIELEILISYQDLNSKDYSSKYMLKFNYVPNTYINFFEPVIRIQLEAQETK